MGRYRPPSPKSAPYITPEGASALEKELKQLWKVERPTVTATVHEAAKNGDRSENGDYIYGKKRLREIDRRVRYLSKRLDEITIVDRIPDDTNKVFFGALVTLKDSDDNKQSFRIVGADEIDPQQHKISIDSPMAQQLLRKKLDDEITISIEQDKKVHNHHWIIIKINYEN
ncbi:MAG: transcription elongation factor GreB [Porticoccus sp.]|nr:transcription elongation factor GreB [Porticoccus sp.]